MRLVPSILPIVLLLTGPAFAHGGHVGELAGHTHWLGLAAVVGAAALAAWARQRQSQQAQDKALEGTSTSGEKSKAQG